MSEWQTVRSNATVGFGAVSDPLEGVDERGMITTGARRDRVAAEFETVVEALVAEVERADPAAEVHLYGSVANGTARVGSSDIDVLTIGLDPVIAADIGTRLTAMFADRCRGVEIGAASASDLVGDHDEAYGFRVFLRHYCVHLAGPDELRPTHDYPADARAARGFNGDIAQHLARWREALELPDAPAVLGVRVARKTLLAVAGLVSIHDATWTTDRTVAAARWGELHPDLADGLDRLLRWSAGSAGVTTDKVASSLDNTVRPIVDQFATTIGLWPT